MDGLKKKALLLFLKGKPGKHGMGKEESEDEDYMDDDSEDESYKSYGEDLLDALRSKDAEKIGRVLCDIISSEKDK